MACEHEFYDCIYPDSTDSESWRSAVKECTEAQELLRGA